MNSSNPSETFSLEDLITEGQNGEFNIKKTSFLVKIGDNVRILTNVFDKYSHFLDGAISEIKLNDDEYEKYKYDPKRLSLELYGSIEMWFLILRLNRCSSTMNFNKRILKLIHPQKIGVLNRILNIIEDDIQKNHYDIYSKK